jgi:predicted DCC family thiol-disulfide oxidoreductase YuxK
MESEGKPKVKIYYDGVCNLCSGLADTIDQSEHGANFSLNDISKDPLPQGVSKEEAMHDVHVVDESGTMYRGADAVLRVLDMYPGFRWIAALGRLPGLHLIAMGVYRVVEQTRYRIFGRKV